MGAGASRERLLELRLSDAVKAAAIQGDLKKLQLILPHPNVKDGNGHTVLHIASWHGHLRIVEYLVKLALVDVNAPAVPGRVTPLLMACWGGHANIVKLLLQHGAAPDGGYDGLGNTALTAALHRGRWAGLTCELSGVRHFHGPRYRATNAAMVDAKAGRHFDLCEEMFVKAAGQLPVETDWVRYDRPGDNFPRVVTREEVRAVERARARLRRKGLQPDGAGFDLRTDDERLADALAAEDGADARAAAPRKRFHMVRTCFASFSVADVIDNADDMDGDPAAARARRRQPHTQEGSDPLPDPGKVGVSADVLGANAFVADDGSAAADETASDARGLGKAALDAGASARMLLHKKQEMHDDGLEKAKGSTTAVDNNLFQKLEDRLKGIAGLKEISSLGMEEEHAALKKTKEELGAGGLADIVQKNKALKALSAPQGNKESGGAFRWRKAKAVYLQPNEAEARSRRRRRIDAQFLDIILMLVESGAKCDAPIPFFGGGRLPKTTTQRDRQIQAAVKRIEEDETAQKYAGGGSSRGIPPALLALTWDENALVVLEALEKGGADFAVPLDKPFKETLALQAAEWGKLLEAQWLIRRGVSAAGLGPEWFASAGVTAWYQETNASR